MPTASSAASPTPKAGPPSVVRDDFGGALGGVRTFWVDYPVVKFSQTSPGPGVCAEMGHSDANRVVAFRKRCTEAIKITRPVLQSLDKSVKDGWITAADAAKLAELERGKGQ